MPLSNWTSNDNKVSIRNKTFFRIFLEMVLLGTVVYLLKSPVDTESLSLIVYAINRLSLSLFH